nr:hypothetical protein GCM10020093_109160 [Planobispora longispora]
MILRMRGIAKSFLGVRVLHGVDLDVAPGEVHAVVGENGAGKSTLMKIIAGVHAPDEGTMEIDGVPVSFGHPVQAQRAGVAIIYQEFNLLPERSVAENVFLGREPVRRGLVDRSAMEAATARLLAELGETSFGPRAPVRRLSVAQQQVVEIVKALSQDARIIVMDEPTAALAGHEVELLYALVARLRERGIAVLYISHRLREVFDLADRVTVLKDGALVRTAGTGDVDPGELVRLMVGRDLGTYFPPRGPGPGRCGSACAAAATPYWTASTSTCAPGRSSGWPGCRGRAAPSWPRRSSGRSRSPGDDEPAAPGLGPPGGRGRDRAGDRGPQGRRARAAAVGAGQRAAGGPFGAAARAGRPGRDGAPGRAGGSGRDGVTGLLEAVRLQPPNPDGRSASCPAATSRRSCWPSG